MVGLGLEHCRVRVRVRFAARGVISTHARMQGRGLSMRFDEGGRDFI